MRIVNVLKFFILFVSLSCGKKNDEIKFAQESEMGSIIIKNTRSIDLKKFEECEAKYTLLYYFDGSCVACLCSVFEWISEWDRHKATNRLKYIFISSDTDEEKFNYYINTSGIVTNRNYFFFVDKGMETLTNNPKIEINKGYFLLDENNRVIISENPILSEEALAVYKKLGLILK